MLPQLFFICLLKTRRSVKNVIGAAVFRRRNAHRLFEKIGKIAEICGDNFYRVRGGTQWFARLFHLHVDKIIDEGCIGILFENGV